MEYKKEKVNKLVRKAFYAFYGLASFVGTVLTYSDVFGVELNYSNLFNIFGDLRIYILWVVFIFASAVYIIIPAIVLVSCVYSFERLISIRFGRGVFEDMPIYIARYIGIGELTIVLISLPAYAYLSLLLMESKFYVSGQSYFFVIFVTPVISLIIYNEILAKGLYPSGRTWSVLFSWHNIKEIFFQR